MITRFILPRARGLARGSQPRKHKLPARMWCSIPLVVVLLIAGMAYLMPYQTVYASTFSGGPSSPLIEGVKIYPVLSHDHVTGTVHYDQNPPVGGPHNPILQNCGIYDTPVQNEHAVHSLEHGAVWITYQPGLSSSEITTLKNLVRGHDHVLLSPYPNLPAPVVASAWGVQLQLQSASDPRLVQFINQYEQGNQTPEVGAPCSGGVGTPSE